MSSKRAIRICLITAGLACAAGFSSIEATHQTHSVQIDLISLHHQRDELAAMIQQGESKLLSATGQTTMPPTAFHTTLTSLEGQREAAGMELLSKEARAAELAKQIKQYQDELAQRAKTDPIVVQLQKVIVPVDEEAKRKESNPQTYAPTEITIAEANAASERVRLLERQDQFGPDAPLMNELRHDQIFLNTEIAELRARYNLLSERASVMRSVERYVDHADLWQHRLERLDAQIHSGDFLMKQTATSPGSNSRFEQLGTVSIFMR